MKKLTVGILAHVDSGKTTLSEALLYASGKIRSYGRVDHKNAYLDTHELERNRGITIFSKQAIINLEHTKINLLDTPGHVDFSAEMERTLQVLDYAILVISGIDGVQSHTETLWSLLIRYNVPTFIFINKMDVNGVAKEKLLKEIKERLSSSCVDFLSKDKYEELAVCSEDLMEEYLLNDTIDEKSIAKAIEKREVFPCFFGSALKLEGIENFIHSLDNNTLQKEFKQDFGGRVYKITWDSQGNRLTHIKITGGNLRVKDNVEGKDNAGAQWQQKINQIRFYSGAKYDVVEQVSAGEVCSLVGLSNTYAGQGLGCEIGQTMPMLEPVLTYSVILPIDIDVHTALSNFKILEQEDPQLHVLWNEQLKEIQLQLMGVIQLEIMQNIVKERFGYDVEFDSGNIVYKETIAEPIYGAGHFEPLRHYAEVHLKLEPLPRGSGLKFESLCRLDELEENWQNLIFVHLAEKVHTGVLTNSAITDMKISIIAGRWHLKHTEGGDFRESTYRAVRHGLLKAKSILLEPYYNFKIEVPVENIGRVLTDIQNMGGTYDSPENIDNMSVVKGYFPVSSSRDYQRELVGYTKGRGKMYLSIRGYDVCHNSKDVIREIGYDPERDLENTGNSVFCSHGVGHTIKWQDCDEAMHTKPLKIDKPQETIEKTQKKTQRITASDEELMAIYEQTYGPIKRENDYTRKRERKVVEHQPIYRGKPMFTGEEYLLVDGYNIIFAWNELKSLAQDNLEAARNRLMDIMCNYCTYKKCKLILVFDAYKIKGNRGSVEEYNNIHVVYTKEAETADMYIEKVTHQIGRQYKVTVATSDNLQQTIVLGHGALRISADMFEFEVKQAEKDMREMLERKYNV